MTPFGSADQNLAWFGNYPLKKTNKQTKTTG